MKFNSLEEVGPADVAEALDGGEVDSGELMQSAAFYCDRSDLLTMAMAAKLILSLAHKLSLAEDRLSKLERGGCAGNACSRVKPQTNRAPASHSTGVECPPCEACGRPTKVRRNSKTGEEFYGCTGFPACRAGAGAVMP